MHVAGDRCDLAVHEGGRHGYLMFDRALYLDTLAKTEGNRTPEEDNGLEQMLHALRMAFIELEKGQ